MEYTNNQEIWKPIDGFEEYYSVSSYGRVKSYDRIVNLPNGGSYIKKGKILKPHVDSDGYHVVKLFGTKINRFFKVHRLVALAFIDNPENLSIVNHIDENKQNNHVENLEWCSVEYNNNYGTRNDRISTSRMGVGKGQPLSEETKRRMSIAHSKPSGRLVSAETRSKISNSLKEYYKGRKNGV